MSERLDKKTGLCILCNTIDKGISGEAKRDAFKMSAPPDTPRVSRSPFINLVHTDLISGR